MNYRINKINSYNGWDPLKQVILGNVFEPEFFEDLPDHKTRDVLQQLLYETHEDLDGIQKTMEDMGIDVVRTPANATMLADLSDGLPTISTHKSIMDWVGIDGKLKFQGHGIPKPCLSPRDFFIAMGDKLLYTNGFHQSKQLEENGQSLIDPKVLDLRLKDDQHSFGRFIPSKTYMEEQGLPVEWLKWGTQERMEMEKGTGDNLSRYKAATQMFWAPTVTRVGDTLVVDKKDITNLPKVMNELYPQFKTPHVAIGGHNDGTFCTPKPGLVVCAPWIEEESFKQTFPGWDVLKIEHPNQMNSDWGDWQNQKHLSQGRWWHPAQKDNRNFHKYVDTWLKKWVGWAEETVFEVNMLSVNESTILSLNYQKEVHDKLKQHGIEPVYCRFRHRNFWDSGLHCLTVDTVREGGMQNYFD